MIYRAVIFDLYDTLLYTRETGTRDEALKRLAEAGVRREDWIRGWRAALVGSMRGTIGSLLDRVRAAVAESGHDDPDDLLADELAALLARRETPHLYPDVHDRLAELRRRGYRLGLLSNIEAHQSGWVHDLGLAPQFDELTLSCEVGLLKPEPEIYLLAAERLSAAPGECVYVADGLAGELPGAKAVGMTAVRIDRSPRDEYEERDQVYDARLATLDELLTWLTAREQGGTGSVGA